MNAYRRQVMGVIRGAAVHSAAAYSWFGNISPKIAGTGRRADGKNPVRETLISHLRSQLYTDFYCQGLAAPHRQQILDQQASGTTPFIQELSAANTGRGCRQSGWHLREVIDGDRVIARRDGMDVVAEKGDCEPAPSGSVTAGTELILRLPKEFISISPGFYMALGNNDVGDEASGKLVRVYWHIQATGAAHFMRCATSLLNGSNIRFKLKAVNEVARYGRCDAAVLYLCKEDYPAASPLLEEIHSQVAGSLLPLPPALTKPLAPGVGLAEDPGVGESFGLNRCQILAEGLVRGFEEGIKSPAGRLRIVEKCFDKKGIDLDHPFLNPRSIDNYALFQVRQRPSHRIAAKRPRVRRVRTGDYLETAAGIGLLIAKQAIWHKDRCNWLGFAPLDPRPGSGSPRANYCALGPELYSGTSGIALFLAELHAVAGEAPLRRAAVGAIRQALSTADRLPRSAEMGLYTGGLGITLAAARLGRILGDEELLVLSAQRLESALRRRSPNREFDLMSGNAGTIVALLSLMEIHNDERLLHAAARFGDGLIKSAQSSGPARSWNTPTDLAQRNLTGFSHGAAGAGYALLELFVATGNAKYRETAKKAFNYERRWFNPETGNWPDFRLEPGERRQAKAPVSYATAWCHGASGIALSRLRAWQILKDEDCRREAELALRTTRQWIETWLGSGKGNYSLCHGLAGNAEVLWEASRVPGIDGASGRAQALDVARAGIELHGRRGNSWPCGNLSGPTPNLMLGYAGIGYFYLRLQNPDTPSILILSPAPRNKVRD